MKTIFYCGRRNVGVCVLTFLVAKGYNVRVSDDSDLDVQRMALMLNCPVVFANYTLGVGDFDLYLSVHSTRIIEKEYLDRGICVNIHPLLSLGYRGKNPVQKYIANKDMSATLDAHFMTPEVDGGELICNVAFETGIVETYEQFYNIALQKYFIVVEDTLKALGI